MRCHSEFGMMRGNQIEGKQPLRSAPIAVHRERNSLEKKGKVGMLAALFKLRRHHRAKLLENFGVVRTRYVGRRKHLVVKRPDLIIPE